MIWPPLLATLGAATFFLAAGTVRIFERFSEVRGERQVLEKKLQELKAEKERLEASVQSAESAEAVERMAKERLNFKKPSESVVVVTQRKLATSSSRGTGQKADNQSSGWLKNILDFLRR